MTTPDPTLAARLAPCPFCGGEASYRTAFGVKCNGCQAGIPCFHHAAITAWNHRTTAEADARVEAAVLAEREACAKACDKIAGNTLDFDRYIRKASGQCAAAIRARGAKS